MTKKFSRTLCSLLLLLGLFAGCADSEISLSPPATEESKVCVQTTPTQTSVILETSSTETETLSSSETVPQKTVHFDFKTIPPYQGSPYAVVNNNVPFFDLKEIAGDSFEKYAVQDSLGRCGPAFASIGRDLMPSEERGPIGMVKPTGWHTVKYDFIDGKYLFNRCHLIGFQLTGENANERNLITGTRYLNIEGMLPFENMTADYVQETGNHVLYRVTPVFVEDELLSRGVLMEGYSLEDSGAGIQFCVFAYNVQPGVKISYKDGSSCPADDCWGKEDTLPSEKPAEASDEAADYIGNLNSKKFHVPGCSSVDSMKESNKYYFHGSREDLIRQGYSPCKRCNP